MNDAQKIMSGTPELDVPPGTPEVVVKALTALPGLVGAIDTAIKEQVGEYIPFILLMFPKDNALHAANFNPAAVRPAIIELAARWAEDALSARQVSAGVGEMAGTIDPEPGTVPVINDHGALAQNLEGSDPDALGALPPVGEPPHITH